MNGLVPFFGRGSTTPSINEVISLYENIMTSKSMAMKKDDKIDFKGRDEQFIILVCNENTYKPRNENSIESTYQIMFDSLLSDDIVFVPARMSVKKHSFTTSSVEFPLTGSGLLNHCNFFPFYFYSDFYYFEVIYAKVKEESLSDPMHSSFDIDKNDLFLARPGTENRMIDNGKKKAACFVANRNDPIREDTHFPRPTKNETK